MRLTRFVPALVVGALFLTSTLPTAAIAQTALSAEETAGLKEAARRGALIHAYDQAAWHGTDDMFAKLKDKTSLGGWIVDGPVDAPVLTFFDDAIDPRVIYVARFRGETLLSGHVLGAGEDRSLSPARRKLIAARRIAQDALRASDAEQCSEQPWNSVVLPPAAPGAPTLVYFLTPRADAATLPFGGHYLVEVSATGQAGPVRHFTRTCLTLPVAAAAKDGDTVAAMSISHLLDPIPTEIHVFLSLSAGLPLAVGTAQNRRVWMVEGSRIRALGPVK